MDPRKDPSRRCLKVEAWPQSDRRDWETALQHGDILEPCNFTSTWKPLTRYTVERSYGRWLTWLDCNELLDVALTPARRASRETVARYVQDLQSLNASYTVLSRVRNLCNALQAMAPEEDWEWLRCVIRRRRRTAVSAKNKRAMIIATEELFDFGLELMNDAEGPSHRTSLGKAGRYRDGLMIAMLASRPIRRRNFASIEIGRHLVRQGPEYWLRFAAEETKTNSPIEIPVPTVLTPYIERYLAYYRPFLGERAVRGNWVCAQPRSAGMTLWVSNWCSAMSEGGIYGRITKATKTRFGHAINPHFFRDCAATSIAIEDPAHVYVTQSILGHTSIKTSERHYNHAQSLEATRRYQRRILELRRQGRDRPASADSAEG
jgi:integrase/recombinase XerD